MKILLIHNHYAALADGEGTLVNNVLSLLEAKGEEVIPFIRSSTALCQMPFGRLRAFFSGLYSWSSRKAVRSLLQRHHPDVAFAHNVFPLLSPSVLAECRQAGVPVVMSINNFRLICPTGLFLINEHACENCSGGREYWCVLNNCGKGILKSLSFALINAAHRRLRLFSAHVSIYTPMTAFQREKLIAAGFPASRITVLPNVARPPAALEAPQLGSYVLYVGRMRQEKGVSSLVAAARQLPQIPFKAAGDYKPVQYLLAQAPSNFHFTGYVDDQRLNELYANCRFIVVCSICYEGFPGVLLEAMLHGKPVVCSRIGGLPEIVDDGVTGLLFEPGSPRDLAAKIAYLYTRPQLCSAMGAAGRQKWLREYSPDRYCEQLLAVFEKAIALDGTRPVSPQL